jgi:hypothetical protein
MITTEVFSDDAGIRIYWTEDGIVMWAESCDGIDQTPEEAAADFIGITVQCIDPLIEGWDWGGFKDLADAHVTVAAIAQHEYDHERGEEIANSDWYKGSDLDVYAFTHADVNVPTFADAFSRAAIGDAYDAEED